MVEDLNSNIFGLKDWFIILEEYNFLGFKDFDFLKILFLDGEGDLCGEGLGFVFFGERGGRESLFGLDKLGERYLGFRFNIGCGIVIGAVFDRSRDWVGLWFKWYVGLDGEEDGENGGERDLL